MGPLRVRVAGEPVAIGGRVRRRLLAGLVVRRGSEVRADWLADLVWPEGRSPATLHSHVAQLRRLLEPDRADGTHWSVLRTVPGGYLLAAERVDVDVDRLDVALHAATSAGSPAERLARLDVVKAPRGSAYEEFDGDAFRAEAARIGEALGRAAEQRLDALLALGRFDEVVVEAADAVAGSPQRERPWLALAIALAETGRSAEAMRRLAEYRRRLIEEAGLDPSPALARLESAIASGAALGEAATNTPPEAPPMRSLPSLQYAVRDGVHIAYQDFGDGPCLVAVPPFAQSVEVCWQDPHHRRLLERAGGRCRFVHFDKRGTGMSDRTAEFGLEERLADFTAVLDASGVERAVLCGVSEAGPLAIAFAVTHPDRVAGLYLVNTFARTTWADDYPVGAPVDRLRAATAAWEAAWGTDARTIASWFAPSLADDETYLAWLAHYMRQACSPGTLATINRANLELDVRHLLADVTAPTVVIHRRDDRVIPIAWGRHLAEGIPGATFVESPGCDHLPWVGEDWHDIIDGAIALAWQTQSGDVRPDGRHG